MAGFLVLPVTVDAGAITGKVTFRGDPRPAKTIKMSADPICETHHGDAKDEKFVVGPAIEADLYPLADAFVYVKSGAPKSAAAVPSTPVVIDQQGCRYIPHVVGVQVGQPVEFKNSDKTMHNVHSLSEHSPSFNRGMPAGSPNASYTFTKPEVMAKVKCDAHPWMSCYVGALDHPFFAVTGEDGAFTIDGLPDGVYEIEVWQELLKTKTAKVTIAGGTGSATVEFSKP
ncbi:MAG: carboxypeptidase regulatory-like domain-containing protein [Verrucomicrobia bacterium]|nr:carboxypeptidase regulatory-like domain-containing protein [Verrucomicrobiota bacterium]